MTFSLNGHRSIDVNDNNFGGITFKQFRIAKIHVQNF